MLVDATAFYLRDAHRIPETLAHENQGAFRWTFALRIYMDRTKNFPRNTEVQAVLMFTSRDPGPWVGSVAPSGEAVTVREHDSFLALPDRPFHPRSARTNSEADSAASARI
jgi:hypothetical protein